MIPCPRYLLAVFLTVLLLPLLMSGSAAAATPEYTVTHTISVSPDGSALWRVEYRTLLPSDQDVADFDAYTRNLTTSSLPEFRGLMEKSAAQAAVATGRHMAVSSVAGTAAVQTSPTGRYGVIIYTLRWEGFAGSGQNLVIGDSFAGGLYLARDNTLVIRYPERYTVLSAAPVPDSDRDGLVWYGQRSFGAGEPRVVLEEQAFPFLPVAAGLLFIVVAAFILFYLYHRNRQTGHSADEESDPLSETEIRNLEERVLHLLRSHGNEMFQSDIVKNLELPKSTVSTVLNDLHARGIIVKVKKGRENLIRLV